MNDLFSGRMVAIADITALSDYTMIPVFACRSTGITATNFRAVCHAGIFFTGNHFFLGLSERILNPVEYEGALGLIGNEKY